MLQAKGLQICYHGRQAGHVCVQHTRDLSKTTIIPKLRPGTTLNPKRYKNKLI